jgi:uncharacterized membrane protein YfcA
MPPLTTLLAVAAVIFAGALCQSTLGFGNALVAMPLLSTLIGLQPATALFGLISLAMGVVLIALGRRSIVLRDSWRLNLAALAGVPVGLWLLRSAPEALIMHGLGALLIAYGAAGLLLRNTTVRTTAPVAEWLVWPFGFVSGILGGAHNTNGPPLVVFGTLQRWEPERFRATLQTVFLTSSIAIGVGHASAGMWTTQTFVQCAACLPLLWLAGISGRWLTRRIEPAAFIRWVYVALIVLGLMLLRR